MPWPVADAWNQHLDEMNGRSPARHLTVSLVRLEPPFTSGWRHTAHVHPYWQAELVEGSNFSVSIGRKELFPRKGDILLIPPQTWHFFHHDSGKKGWSLKFAVEEMDGRYQAAFLPRGEAAKIAHASLLSASRAFLKEPSAGMKAVLERLLALAVDIYCESHPFSSQDDELTSLVRKAVEERVLAGKTVKVSEIAAKRKCSSVYLNRVFKRTMGVPVKVYIDQFRFETARRLLLDSKLNIGEIASEMGFDDIFLFSRFFKRMSGSSPANFRRALQALPVMAEG